MRVRSRFPLTQLAQLTGNLLATAADVDSPVLSAAIVAGPPRRRQARLAPPRSGGFEILRAI